MDFRNKPISPGHKEVTLSYFPPVHVILGNQAIIEMSLQYYDLALCPQLLLRADIITGSMKKLLIKLLLKTPLIILFDVPIKIIQFMFFSRFQARKGFTILMILFDLFHIV